MMNVNLSPERREFVERQVRKGRFSSVTEVLEAGLARLMLEPEPEPLDAQDMRSVEISLAQVKCGMTVDWGEFSREWRERCMDE